MVGQDLGEYMIIGYLDPWGRGEGGGGRGLGFGFSAGAFFWDPSTGRENVQG